MPRQNNRALPHNYKTMGVRESKHECNKQPLSYYDEIKQGPAVFRRRKTPCPLIIYRLMPNHEVVKRWSSITIETMAWEKWSHMLGSKFQLPLPPNLLSYVWITLFSLLFSISSSVQIQLILCREQGLRHEVWILNKNVIN